MMVNCNPALDYVTETGGEMELWSSDAGERPSRPMMRGPLGNSPWSIQGVLWPLVSFLEADTGRMRCRNGSRLVKKDAG